MRPAQPARHASGPIGVTGKAMGFIDDAPAGDAILTDNLEDTPLGLNDPPHLNNGGAMRSHDILRHISGPLAPPAAPHGALIRFDQAPVAAGAPERAGLAPCGYAYVPTGVAGGRPALGVHVVQHGCKQGYDYRGFDRGFGGGRARSRPAARRRPLCDYNGLWRDR